MRSTVAPPDVVGGTSTEKERVIVAPLTTGACRVTAKPVVAERSSEVTARSSDAAASMRIGWPAYACSNDGVTSKRVICGAALATTLKVDTAVAAVRPARSVTIALSVIGPGAVAAATVTTVLEGGGTEVGGERDRSGEVMSAMRKRSRHHA